LAAAADLLRGGAMVAMALLCAGCLYLVFTSVRLTVLARRDELEILKLCGATDRFVRAPLWIEGAATGLLGGAIGVGALLAVHRAAAPRLETLLRGVLGRGELRFAPIGQVALALAGCAVIGLLGAHFAARRHLRV